MKKRLAGWIMAGLLTYILLLVLLVLSEKTAPGSGIRSFGDAVWYSLVTLSTVGYGDLTPVSIPGKAIGTLFMLLSLGILASLLGAAVTFLREKLRSRTLYFLLSRNRCAFFSEKNEAAVSLATDLRKQDAEIRLVFCRAEAGGRDGTALRRVFFLPQSVTEAVREFAETGDGKMVFLIGENAMENLACAAELKSLPEEIFCRGPERDDPDVRSFDAPSCAARNYWQKHPLSPEERVVLIAGCGETAAEMLNQALLANCREPFFASEYHLFGNWDPYLRNHPGIRNLFDGRTGGNTQDTLHFHPGNWDGEPELAETADRVIFCEDDRLLNASEADRLLRLFPVSGRVFAFSAAAPAGAEPFGSPEEIFTAENVIRGRLDERAKWMHRLYCRKEHTEETWESLSCFLKASNRASADHLPTKLRLLLKGEEIREVTAETCRKAAERWKEAGEREPYRRNEHERWIRYYAMNNWTCGPEKNPKLRTHPCLVPYDRLPEEERRKDDLAWDLIGQLAAEGEEGS